MYFRGLCQKTCKPVRLNHLLLTDKCRNIIFTVLTEFTDDGPDLNDFCILADFGELDIRQLHCRRWTGIVKPVPERFF